MSSFQALQEDGFNFLAFRSGAWFEPILRFSALSHTPRDCGLTVMEQMLCASRASISRIVKSSTAQF